MPADEPDFFTRQTVDARRFYLDLRPNSGSELIVTCGGWERCTADYRMERNDFRWIACELVIAGEGDLILAGEHHRLIPGSLFTYGPGIAHTITSDQQRPLHKYFLDLSGDDAATMVREAGLTPGTIRHLPSPLRSRELLDMMIGVGLSGGPNTPTVCAHLARALFLTVAEHAVEPSVSVEPAYTTYLRCRNWLERYGRDIASLEEAAKSCQISSAHFCRLFRRYDHESPWKLVRRLRLQHGADLLADPQQRVADVAERLGYADAFHFSRAFRQAFGTSPQQFRSVQR